MEGILNQHAKNHENIETDIYVNLCYDLMDEVQALLKSRSWSQKDLAEKMGKSPAEVSKMINGLHNVTYRTVAKLSAALEVDLIYTSNKAKANFGMESHTSKSIFLEKSILNMPETNADYTEGGKVIKLKLTA